ncbi:hypothetical protein A6F68_01866 [Tsuneonella dongtanensis]|uniref:Metallo-beta-lactamase domain-containing protein n=1 Tax=Tsuneonella dongtanensis TaxID=692370 RepID=A0A1B2AE07_9SPHN|nr:hypothetical protein [Tsuneonella dongtanensis]ANY20376.1 hypothetical protein A6F68_01866 [Tsuneonella dongtanensis]
MSRDLIDCGDGFWSIRGDFRIGGLVNVGTQCALVRRPDGSFIILDSYTLPDAVLSDVDRITGGRKNVSAIINLHPFHTVHCQWMHDAFPAAALYGTARHHAKWPDLPWASEQCESGALGPLFGDTLEFSLPRGVALVCEDENVHFSSVLAYHRESRTIYVDDTLSYLTAPFPLSLLPMTGRLDFHMTLAKALEPRAGAADDFRDWAIEIGTDWADAVRVATAHNTLLRIKPGSFPELIGAALGRVAPVLDGHRRKHG